MRFALCRKRKLLIIVGAGASLEFGMPTTTDVDALIRARVHRLFVLADDSTRNLYGWLSDAIVDDWKRNFPGRGVPNYEDVLLTLFLLDGLRWSPARELLQVREVPQICFLGNSADAVTPDVWHALSCFVADAIVDEFRQRCRELEPERTSDVDDVRALFHWLSNEYEISVATVNYDDIVRRCLPDLATGFNEVGDFDDRLLLCRKAWPCLLHLHGSVHFDMRITGNELHVVHWQDRLDEAFSQNSFGRSAVTSPGAFTFPQSVLVAGHGKTSQILRRPYRTYYSELDRLLVQSDALLCLGYGFGDDHLNAAISAYRDDRRRPVVIVDWAEDNQMTAADARSDVARQSIVTALQVLHTAPNTMRGGGESPRNVSGLKRRRDLDCSTDDSTPLAIWYGGMQDACRNAEKVLRALRG